MIFANLRCWAYKGLILVRASALQDLRGISMNSSIGKAPVYLCVSFVALVCASWIGACKRGIEPVEAVISLDSATEGLKKATIVVDYSQSGAAPLNNAGRPACTSILPHVATEFSDDGQGTLTIEAKSAQTFSGPLEVAACRMVPNVAGIAGATIAARLRVSLVGGTTAAGTRLEPQRLAEARGAYRSPSASAPGSANPSAATGARSAPAAGTNTVGTARPASPGSAASPSSAEAMRIQRDGSTIPPSGADRPSARNQAPAPANERNQGQQRGDSFGGATPGGSTPGGAPASAAQRGYDPTDNQPVPEYLVQIGVTSTSGLLGALQFVVNHTGSSGGWQGAGGSVNCTFNTPAALAVCNDVGGGRLKCGVVDTSGFDTPSTVVSCVFKTEENLRTSDFAVSVEEASDVELNKMEVTMAITGLVQQ